MAHLSGYTGNISFTGAASDTIFSPTLGTDLEIQAWSIRQTTDEFGVSSKSEAWEVTFGTASEWTATATFLLEDSIVAPFDVEIRGSGTTDAEKTFDATFITTTGEKYAGVGIVANIVTDDPLDGPVTVTVELEGNGELTFAGTGP